MIKFVLHSSVAQTLANTSVSIKGTDKYSLSINESSVVGRDVPSMSIACEVETPLSRTLSKKAESITED